MNTHQHTSEVQVFFEPKVVEAGKPTFITISVTEKGKNLPLEVVHTMRMHLLLVNEELTWFDHVHPKKQANGTYGISEIFPSAGKYFLFIDCKPIGHAANVNMKSLEVKGTLLEQEPERNIKLVADIEAYTVSLLNGNDLKTNTGQDLKFLIEKDGKPIDKKDMQPYLGANAHIVLINQDDKDFLHIHSMSSAHFPIYAETYIEKAGLYRMWVQFKIEGKVYTTDFTLQVSKGEEILGSHPIHDVHH